MLVGRLARPELIASPIPTEPTTATMTQEVMLGIDHIVTEVSQLLLRMDDHGAKPVRFLDLSLIHI